ncbi:hypothetical protein Tco_0809136 [Tanacetum coccineum]
MESEKYLEGQSMQRPPLFERGGFIYWKNRFETYVKSKDLDLWHVITDGDFPPIQNNPEKKKDEVVPFHKQNDDLKKKLAKNNEAKMVTKMPKATTTDISLTKSYIPKVSKIPGISPTIAQFYKPIKNRNIHEGRVVDQAYYKSNNIERLFTNIRTSSHQHDDDDDDNVQTSRTSTPSPTTYLNSLDPLNYQNYQMPSASEQTDETLFERQTVFLNQTQQMHKEMRGGFNSYRKALKGVFS